VVTPYSFEIVPFVPVTFGGATIEVQDFSPSGSVRKCPDLVVGQDGTASLVSPVLVSANTLGPLHLQITCTKEVEIRITKLLQTYVTSGGQRPDLLSPYVFLLIPHLLRDSYSYFRALLASGMNPGRAFVVGIPYSTKAEVVDALWEKGLPHIWTPKQYPFASDVEAAMREALTVCANENRRLIVVEDGGYIGPRLHNSFSEHLPRCAGIVEQTRNGVWQYQETEVELGVPLLNVAESRLKIESESPLIGEAVVDNVRELLHNYGYRLANFRPLVVGYGSTGSEVAKTLLKHVENVAVFDEREERRRQAAEDGFAVSDGLSDLLRDHNLIIACTGAATPPFQLDELTALEHDAVFANASSKRREIDYEQLAKLTREGGIEHIPGVGTRYTLVTDRSFLLLADGYPVNFVGESVPDEDISFIPALLYKTACFVAENDGNLAAGIQDVPEELQEEIRHLHQALMPR